MDSKEGDALLRALVHMVAQMAQLNSDNDNLVAGGSNEGGSSDDSDQASGASTVDPKTFLQAAASGSESRCRSLLKAGMSVMARDSSNSTGLHVAAYNNRIGVARMLLKGGADIDAVDNDGDTPLICAVMKRHENMVELLLDSGAEVDVKNKKKMTAADVALVKQCVVLVRRLEKVEPCLQFDCDLHTRSVLSAAQEGAFDVIEFWLVNHPDKEVCDHRYMKDRTIAFVAALNNHTDILQLLASMNADFEISDKRGHSPLFCAAQEGHVAAAEFLVKAQKCDVNKRSSTKRTPIFTAVIHGHYDIVKLLLDNGADANRADEDGTTPIECAVRQNQAKIFRLLVQRKADVLVADNRGYDLMMTAAKCGVGDMVQLLHEYRVPVDRVNNQNGETAVLIACQYGHEDILRFLLSKGSDENHQNHNGVSPALRAAYNGHAGLLRVLGEAKAELDLPNLRNETAILCAAQKDSLEMVMYLTEKKCSLSVKDDDGKTLAWYAAKNDNVELLRFLHQSGAPLDEHTKKGRSPLMEAVKAGNVKAAEMLVRFGCSRTKKGKSGENATSLANASHNPELLAALQSRPPTIMSSKVPQSTRLPSSRNSSRMTVRPATAMPRNLDSSFKEWQVLEKDKEPIGEGAFGKVYRAFTDKQQFVAVKVVSTSGLTGDRKKAILQGESAGVDLLSKIDHPNVLAFLKCEMTRDGNFCIFTELIAGVSLSDLMEQRRKAFEEPAVVKFSLQICTALNFLHSRRPPVLHRDIKGSNIMLTNEGVIKLIDFGLAKEIAGNSSEAIYQSRTQCGTLPYMAPELIFATDGGRVAYTPLSDVWAFGCTIYELCTMQPPNIEGGAFMLQLRLLTQMPNLPSAYSKRLKDFYRRCVEKDADSRATTDDLLSHPLLLNCD